MKKLLILAVFLIVSEPAFAFPTNMASAINIRLTIRSQGATNGLNIAAPASVITSKTIIAAFGEQLGVHFSPAAQLLAIRNISYSTNFFYSTNGYRVTTTKQISVLISPDRDVIKDGNAIVSVDSFFAGDAVSQNIDSHVNSTDYKFTIADITIAASSLPISLRGYVTRTLIWNAKTSPIYSESWSSVVGTVGNSVAQGIISASIVAYNVPY